MQNESPREETPACDRRTFIGQSAATLAVAGAATQLLAPRAANAQTSAGAPAAAAAPTGPHKLPKLGYDFGALEPHIDAKTMEIHYTKHHQAYVDKLNAAVANHADLAKLSAEQLIQQLNRLPEDIRAAVQNNGGGHVNHTFFWKIMGPGKGGQPKGELADAINQKFGSFDKLKEAVAAAAAGRFGSGWAWLVKDGSGNLEVMSTANQDSPLSQGKTPIIGVDVWEHAYYLKYQNKRPDYVSAWWNVVDWDQAAKNYAG
jgi:Fe-Mn family superoxide dismutase